MSCYVKHPNHPGIECWHGDGHQGNHGKESYQWANDEDPARRYPTEMLRRVEKFLQDFDAKLDKLLAKDERT